MYVFKKIFLCVLAFNLLVSDSVSSMSRCFRCCRKKSESQKVVEEASSADSSSLVTTQPAKPVSNVEVQPVVTDGGSHDVATVSAKSDIGVDASPTQPMGKLPLVDQDADTEELSDSEQDVRDGDKEDSEEDDGDEEIDNKDDVEAKTEDKKEDPKRFACKICCPKEEEKLAGAQSIGEDVTGFITVDTGSLYITAEGLFDKMPIELNGYCMPDSKSESLEERALAKIAEELVCKTLKESENIRVILSAEKKANIYCNFCPLSLMLLSEKIAKPYDGTGAKPTWA